MGAAGGFIGDLEVELMGILKELKSGRYQFTEEDLSYMALVNSVNDILLPFKHLLRLI